MKKKLVTLFLAIILVFTTVLTACGGKKGSSDADLVITFFNGGYGEDWINNLARRFEQAKGVKVTVKKSEEGNCGAENFIKSGYNLSDIYIAEGVNWKSLVQLGKLEDLTDVYEAEVDTRNGKQKIKDFMDQSIVGNFYSQRRMKDTTYVPWAMPWTAKVNAMAYNEDILKEVKHVSQITVSEGLVGESGKWVDVPKTIQDMEAFFEDVKAFNNNSAEKQALGDTHNYVPFGWCGSINADSIGFLIVSWWAEAQGLTKSNYEGEGTFYDFFNYGNVTDSNIGQTYDLDVFKQSGLKLAYDTFADLLIDSTNHTYKNTLSDPYNTNLQQLQELFVANKVTEKPVLAIASSYLENEVRKNKYLDSDQDGKQDVNFKYMNVPKLKAEDEDLLYLNFSDSIIVPSAAKHKDLAKQFLIFMSSEQEVDNFAFETQGGIRPFNCDVRTAVTGNQYTAYANSLFEVYNNSTHVYEYPANVSSLAKVSHIFRYSNPGYHGNVEWLTILNLLRDPSGKTPGEAISDAVILGIKQSMLSQWVADYKLTELHKN